MPRRALSLLQLYNAIQTVWSKPSHFFEKYFLRETGNYSIFVREFFCCHVHVQASVCLKFQSWLLYQYRLLNASIVILEKFQGIRSYLRLARHFHGMLKRDRVCARRQNHDHGRTFPTRLHFN